VVGLGLLVGAGLVAIENVVGAGSVVGLGLLVGAGLVAIENVVGAG